MKRVFLSFAYEDTQKVKNLVPELMSPDFDIDFYEGSSDIDFDSEAATSIKRAIGEKITKCNVTVCLIGEHTYTCKWVDCQLNKSRHKGNKIIAMALKGEEWAVLPRQIKEENITFYPWNPKKLAMLICENEAKPFNNSL